ncbi:MAG: tRNA pseudouridine(55) synthase TruB [Armatimonadota bacterium]
MPLNGVLNVDKPAGVTSHDVVDAVRRLARQRRVGHAGTLDPMATGVLPVCLGKATRLSEAIAAGRKVYVAEVTFGAVTDTQDSTGAVIEQADASHLTPEDVLGVLPRFTGTLSQLTPMVSARRVNGRRLYELARRGEVVERQRREVQVYALELLWFQSGARPTASLRVTCSGGTYVRTLAHDIGAALGVGAHMSGLRRIQVGPFTEEFARGLDELEELASCGRLEDALTPMAEAVAHLPRVCVARSDVERVRHGGCPREWTGDVPLGAERVGVVGPDGELIAMARAEAVGGTRMVRLRPYAVFAERGPSDAGV